MRVSRIAALLAVAGLLAGCQDEPVAPTEDSPEVLLNSDRAADVSWEDLDFWFPNLCGPFGPGYGPVQWNGVGHFVERHVEEPPGVAHWIYSENWKMVGVSEVHPGWWWRWNEKWGTQSNWEIPYAAGETQDMWYIQNRTLNLVGHGGAPTLKEKVRIHYTVNANGVEVNYVEQVDPLCE